MTRACSRTLTLRGSSPSTRNLSGPIGLTKGTHFPTTKLVILSRRVRPSRIVITSSPEAPAPSVGRRYTRGLMSFGSVVSPKSGPVVLSSQCATKLQVISVIRILTALRDMQYQCQDMGPQSRDIGCPVHGFGR